MSSVRDLGAPSVDRPIAPRWTPPIPPVANTRIPAAAAAIIVAETVVAAQPPPSSAAARFGRAALTTEPAGAVASVSRSASASPTSSRPSWIATVAGTAPAARTAASDARATARFAGYWQPVADQRRLERDDRPAVGEGGGHLGAEREPVRDRHGPEPSSAPCQPSWSSRRGVATWRPAIRLPATAARRRASTGDRPAAREASHSAMNPASKASPAPVVSAAATGRVATSNRIEAPPSAPDSTAPTEPGSRPGRGPSRPPRRA